MIRVIIVTYNSQEDIKTCLKQLTKSADYTLDITVVDSNSTDGTLKYIRNAYPQIDIIKCDHNGGYAYANNIGISKYLGSNKEPKAFLILNPDCSLINFISKDLFLISIFGYNFINLLLSAVFLN